MNAKRMAAVMAAGALSLSLLATPAHAGLTDWLAQHAASSGSSWNDEARLERQRQQVHNYVQRQRWAELLQPPTPADNCSLGDIWNGRC